MRTIAKLHMLKLDHKKNAFFHRKSAKIDEIIDHNSDPRYVGLERMYSISFSDYFVFVSLHLLPTRRASKTD
jgi:hypothetical protein